MAIVFLPFVVLRRIWLTRLHTLEKVIFSFLTLFILLPLWITLEGAVVMALWFFTLHAGIRTTQIPTAGASMLPTLSEHDFLSVRYFPGYGPFKHVISHEDIVVFSNDATEKFLKKEHQEGSGLVKRVIGTSSDTIMIRDGFVYRNGELIEEPYTVKPRSTFGGDAIKDCQTVKIAEGELFVLGDNRKQSADSRHLGLIPTKDVKFYTSLTDQKNLTTKWRDASRDKHSTLEVTLNIEKYLDLLNQKRKEGGVTPLKYQDKLHTAATKRAQIVMKYNDLSFEATKSGYTMEKAMADAGYSNIVWGEAPAIGYYEAEELINYYFEFPEWRKFLLNKDFQETGISAIVGDINGCPSQVIVQHFAGYKPPNYPKATIDSWRTARDSIESVFPSWEKAKESSNLPKEEVQTLVNYLTRQRQIAQTILGKMESNRWLSADEERSIKEFEELAKKSNELAKKLNQQ